MAKFCGRCGTRLDSEGYCPNRCDGWGRGAAAPQPLSRKEQRALRKQAKHDAKKAAKQAKRDAKKAAKRAKRAAMTTGQKVGRFFLVVLIVVLVGAGLLTATSYYGITDIPVIQGAMERAGIGIKSGTAAVNPKVALDSQLRAVLLNEAEVDLVSEFGERIYSLQGGDIQKKIMSCISVSTKIKSLSKDKCVLAGDFRYPDIVGMAERYLAEESTLDGFREWMWENLDENSASLKMEVTFEMTRHDGRWEIIVPAQFYDVLTGGMQSYISQANEDVFMRLQGGES